MTLKSAYPVKELSRYLKNSRLRDLQKSTIKSISPSLVMLSTFPPKECGLATFASDLVQAIQNQYSDSYVLYKCALNLPVDEFEDDFFHVLDTENPESFTSLAQKIKKLSSNEWIIVQHEFGLYRNHELELLELLNSVEKKIMVVLHTVLPQPPPEIEAFMHSIAFLTHTLVVMTANAKTILIERYAIDPAKIIVIPHGTHLVEHQPKLELKKQYDWANRTILSTFGLLSSGKSIETTLLALPQVIERFPDVLFLIVGKTHPGVIHAEGERYRASLEQLIQTLGLEHHTLQLNAYLDLPHLLEILQLTDVYIFTSKNQDQAVSGTFAYALSCGCPIVATPIPHAIEVVNNGCGILFDFEQPDQLAKQLIYVLERPELQLEMRLNGLHRIEPTAWQNTAIHYIKHLQNHSNQPPILHYKWPIMNSNHIKKMTTHFGMLQFAKLNVPDTNSGYTLDDNARALIAICQHYTLTSEADLLVYVERYLRFIVFCLQPDGKFLNYVDLDETFTSQNEETNLEDCFGRAIWAIGFLMASPSVFPTHFLSCVEGIFEDTLHQRKQLQSPRAIAFTIKGLYYAHQTNAVDNREEIEALGNQLLRHFNDTATTDWAWFEPYLTYGNSILPEALLLAWKVTQKLEFKTVAMKSMDFLMSQIFNDNKIRVISNKGWLHAGQDRMTMSEGGEQPIDVAYAVMALDTFFQITGNPNYFEKMKQAYHWFLGENNRNEIIYNPKTGGCYDGLEHDHVNLNQGAESTLSHLLARQALEKYSNQEY
ncbi:MAG: hypothetical protein RL607_2202 [Bacteroidota bacterium]|jgi:glycosyltransferase involved in cell wall biosynthesis